MREIELIGNEEMAGRNDSKEKTEFDNTDRTKHKWLKMKKMKNMKERVDEDEIIE